MENAELTFKTVPTMGQYRDCSQEFEIKEMYWTRPSCKGNSIQLVSGNVLFVGSIEMWTEMEIKVLKDLPCVNLADRCAKPPVTRQQHHIC